MNSRERVMCALAGEQPDRVPFCEGSVDAAVAREIAGQESNLSEREISDLLGRDVVVAVVFPPYFADQEVGEDGQSYVTSGWIKTREDLDKMIFPDPAEPALYEEAEKILAEKGDHAAAAAIKLGVAPALISMGLEAFSYALVDDPDLVHEVLKRYTAWQQVVTEHLINLGFDFLWSFDDIAYKSGPFCSLPTFREFLLPAMQAAAESITIPWVFHSDGNIMPVLEDLLTLGMDGLHPLEPGPMDLAEVKQKFGDQLCLIGNVSVDALSSAGPEEIEQIVRECITAAGPGGGYMVSSSNSIPSYAGPENVRALAEAVQTYGRYPLEV